MYNKKNRKWRDERRAENTNKNKKRGTDFVDVYVCKQKQKKKNSKSGRHFLIS